VASKATIEPCCDEIYARLVEGPHDEADAPRPASNRFEQQADRRLELAAVAKVTPPLVGLQQSC
jgi:hypothetical protein